ncbi:MAG TPA: permease [Geopsychrobacteraceae bacterium]|nr:permease [Geopsychrobacteraceae bacterium]
MFKVGLIYLIMISTAYLILVRIDRGKTLLSLQVAGRSLRKLIPLLIAVFGMVGLFQVFLSPQQVEQALGASNGWISLFIGGALGAVSIGPPLAAYPLAGSMLDAGAWPPAVAAFVICWISIGIITLPFEASVFSLRYALLRNGIGFVIALIIGTLLGVLL